MLSIIVLCAQRIITIEPATRYVARKVLLLIIITDYEINYFYSFIKYL